MDKICLNCRSQFRSRPGRAPRARFCSMKCRGSLSREQKFMLAGWTETPNGCHEWKGQLNAGGYGYFNHQGKRVLAHRQTWQNATGLPPAADILHKCDNRKCVRLDHLFEGTDADNVADMIAKGRRASSVGSSNNYAKLTEEDIPKIRASTQLGVDLAAELNVSPSTISLVRRGKTWAHVG